MSTGPTPLNQLVAQAIANAQALVKIINDNAVNGYQLQKANIQKWNETMPPNMAQAPLPQPPTIYMVNTVEVTAEETSGNLDLSRCLIPVQYVDPNPPATIPSAGNLVVDTAHPLAPGIFSTASGNPHYLPAGYLLTQDGHGYRLGFSLTGPYWQQVS